MKYVYMLRAGKEHYKVGVSNNVTKRVKTLQTSNPTKIEVVMTRLVDDAYYVEMSAHHKLRIDNTGGGKEWFKLTPEQAIEIAIEINRNPEIDMSQQITVRNILEAQTERQKSIESMLKFVLDRYTETLEPYVAPEKREVNINEKPGIVELTDDTILSLAKDLITKEGRASTSFLQRKLSIGYGRAARIMDKLEKEGVVGELDGIKREVLIKA